MRKFCSAMPIWTAGEPRRFRTKSSSAASSKSVGDEGRLLLGCSEGCEPHPGADTGSTPAASGLTGGTGGAGTCFKAVQAVGAEDSPALCFKM